MSLHEILEETKKKFLMKKQMMRDALREAEAAVARSKEADAKVYALWERATKEVLALDIDLVEADPALNELVGAMMTKLETVEMSIKNIPMLEGIIHDCKIFPHKQ
jgi:hypothetical protein